LLMAGDTLARVNGKPVDADGFDAAVAGAHPDDRLRLAVEREGRSVEVSLTLGHRFERTFRIRPVAHPSALQAAILASWTAPAPR
jgi:hypothetical protein